jgi:hypothetical protein
LYLSRRGRFKGEDVSKGRDDVNSETNKERSNGGIDGSKEREYNSQKPNWNNNW